MPLYIISSPAKLMPFNFKTTNIWINFMIIIDGKNESLEVQFMVLDFLEKTYYNSPLLQQCLVIKSGWAVIK